MKANIFVFVAISLAVTNANLNKTDNAKQCRLPAHPSVLYRCIVESGEQECQDVVGDGRVVKPECRANFYHPTPLPTMRCVSGAWDYVATCLPDCGTVVPQGQQLKRSTESAKRGEAPWHVGVYTKKTTPYMQICGGSLVSTNIVISAAHCFWDSSKRAVSPASEYAVAAGKLYRPWTSTYDGEAQQSDVSEINLPHRFQGLETNYQDDISVLTLATPVHYTLTVRPVCLDFDLNFEKRQLKPGNFGKIASWGAVSEAGSPSSALRVLELPYVAIEQCIAEVPASFREYITSDKICAYNVKDSSQKLCRGSGGSGLAFPTTYRGVSRFYLRGVTSTAPSTAEDGGCSQFVTFTEIVKHELFVKEHFGV